MRVWPIAVGSLEVIQTVLAGDITVRVAQDP